MNNRLTSENFLNTANGYLAALQILADNAKLNKAILHPIGLLASQAVELGLKSYLLSKGQNDSDLKNIGHNLDKAWDASIKAGLRLNVDNQFSVRVLSLSHDKPFYYRYPQEGIAAGITDTDVLCQDIKAILDAVGCSINIKSDEH